MKIDLSQIDHDQFMVNPYELNGEFVYLIQPQQISCKWTQSNKHLRSSLWNSNGELISAGMPKFTNFGENPDNFPVPDSLKNATITQKIDGSLLIISKYLGNFIIRTRGTIDVTKMDNGHEIEIFKNTILYFKLHNFTFAHWTSYDTWPCSILFEWYSPENRIVVKYDDIPQWYLIGVVNHDDYTLWDQQTLDKKAYDLGLLRPLTYNFNSIPDLIELVKNWEGKEGIVLYTKKDQVLHKIKSNWYLLRHRLKEEFSNYEKVLDYYISLKCPSFDVFQQKIIDVVDFETANEIVGDISRCVDTWKEVQKILQGMDNFVNTKLLPLGNPKDKKTRGEMAKWVLSSYSNSNKAGMIFKKLDLKELDADDLKRLFYQVLKK